MRSGSSSNAAVAQRLGLADRQVTVRMPGGEIDIEIGEDFAIRMIGMFKHVAEGTLQPELFTVTV